MKRSLSLIAALVAAGNLSAQQDALRADPDIFDGSLMVTNGEQAGGAEDGAPADAEPEPTAESDDQANDAEAEGVDEGSEAEGDSMNGDSTNGDPTTGDSADGDSQGDADAAVPGEFGGPAEAGQNGDEGRDREAPSGLGDLPQIEEVRIGGGGSIHRPVEPEAIVVPRVTIPRLPEASAREERQDPPREASPVERADDRQPPNQPVRRSGGGDTVPTDF